MKNMDLTKIKLIVWDLDETLWKGVISDGEVELPLENISLIRNTTDCGVINSICSKNDIEPVKNRLTDAGIWSLFVFNSINWSPKGDRVYQVVKEMNLRFPNVLFIDDNPLNREEVAAMCKDIMVSDVDIIPELISYFETAKRKDPNHERLDQYKVLEVKNEFRAKAGSNTAFLEQSNIRVDILKDCGNHIERITDLIARSNQLNFTKIRSTAEEIEKLVNDISYECGYVSVKDNYGEYGIVGFYALKDNILEHFVFSCRTLGMGVEQYVYKTLGCPELTVVGEVSSDVNSPDPYWVNTGAKEKENSKTEIKNNRIVLKGLCDMQQMFAYIAENRNIITEFEYVNGKGVSIEQRNHTMHVVQSLAISEDEKIRLTEELPFGDKDMFNTSVFNKDIRYVVFSLFTDPNMGMYRSRKTGTIVAFGEYTNDITDRKIWNKLINKELFVANCDFTLENIESFSKEFEYIGRIKAEEIISNLETIYQNIAQDCTLILVLGSELEYKGENKPAYLDRHLYNQKLNSLVKEWAEEKSRVEFININEIATEPNDYTNNINHFTRSVYFRMTEKLISIIEKGGNSIRQNGEFVANLTHLKRKITKAFMLIISVFRKK